MSFVLSVINKEMKMFRLPKISVPEDENETHAQQRANQSWEPCEYSFDETLLTANMIDK